MSSEKLAFQGLYSEAKSNVEAALTNISSIQLEDTQGKEHLQNVTARLQEISNKFGDDVKFLEENSEWDKFTIAFFGETGAGKSTILEALRIIFNERERQEQIKNGTIIKENLEKSFAENSNNLIKGLVNSVKVYEKETRDLKEQISDFTVSVKDYEQEKKDCEQEKTNLLETKRNYNVLADKYKNIKIIYVAIAVISLIVGAVLMNFVK